MLRIFAGALGLFSAINALAGFVRPEWDANIWWIDLRVLPDLAARCMLLVFGVLLIAWSCSPKMAGGRRALTLAAIAGALTCCAVNAVTFFQLYLNGAIRSALPVPLSLILMVLLSLIFVAVLKNATPVQPLNLLGKLSVAGAIVVCLAGFPLAQIYLFGNTNYCRQAEAAVVFGARVYADGSLSLALSDRVKTACALHREGWVKTLIFSGGPGDGRIHEVDAMRALALKLNVPDHAIVLDRAGINTRATLEFTRQWTAEKGTSRVLAVSHFYHLPRIKLDSQRMGLAVLTVPAKESRRMVKMPWLVAREVAALWKYYLLPPI